MDYGTKLVLMGIVVLLIWLFFAYYDRLPQWKPPWQRWMTVREDTRFVDKLLLLAFAVIASFAYVLMLAAAISG